MRVNNPGKEVQSRNGIDEDQMKKKKEDNNNNSNTAHRESV